ncbi:MAG: hypothetical protein ACRDIB_19325, partial [Ardenticatenaceae bacterium]
IGLSELTHPPVYYLLTSLPLRLLHHLDVTTLLYIGRGVSLLLFLLFILVAAGITHELAPVEHPLRWAVPLALALFPPFVSQMTALNNDVGAVLAFSFFLWAAVNTIRGGLSHPRLLWLVGAALLALFTKSTAAVALGFLPLVVLLALWRWRGWQWRWFWLAVAPLPLLLAVGLFTWDDAAYWYREEWQGAQRSPTRVASHQSPFGAHALHLKVSSDRIERRLLNPLSPEQVEEVGGQTVTVGGWIWATRETQAFTPGLVVSPQGTRDLNVQSEVITVTTTPSFVARRYPIPADAGKVYYLFWGKLPGAPEESLQLFLDGAFLLVE